MGLADVAVDAMARAATLADDNRIIGIHRDPDTGDIAHAPSGILRRADLPLALGNAFELDRRARPRVETKDAIGFRDDVPALNVTDVAATLIAALDMRRTERGGERDFLLFGKHQRGLQI